MAQAKARFSEMVDRAPTSGAQEVQRRGRTVAFVVSAEEWARRTRPRGSMLDFFRDAGLLRLGVERDEKTGAFHEVNR